MKNVSIYPNNSSKPPLTFTTAMGRLPYSNYERKLQRVEMRNPELNFFLVPRLECVKAIEILPTQVEIYFTYRVRRGVAHTGDTGVTRLTSQVPQFSNKCFEWVDLKKNSGFKFCLLNWIIPSSKSAFLLRVCFIFQVRNLHAVLWLMWSIDNYFKLMSNKKTFPHHLSWPVGSKLEPVSLPKVAKD